MNQHAIVQVTLWEAASTPVAICGAVAPDDEARQVWIPLSLVKRMTRRWDAGVQRAELTIHLPQWKARELALKY